MIKGEKRKESKHLLKAYRFLEDFIYICVLYRDNHHKKHYLHRYEYVKKIFAFILYAVCLGHCTIMGANQQHDRPTGKGICGNGNAARQKPTTDSNRTGT